MELRENRTELERLLGGVWDYEDVGDKKTSLPKWLFALTLTGAVVCTLSPSDIVVPVMTALAPAPEKLAIDNVSSANVAEDLDFRIARHTDSPAGWRAFLEAHPDGPHAQAARAEIDRPSPEPSPQPEQSRAPTQTPDDTAHETAALSAPPMMIEEEPAPPPQPVEVAEQSSPSPPATQTPVDAAQSPAAPAPPVMAEEEPAPPAQPVEVADQFPPSSAATQAPVQAAPIPGGARGHGRGGARDDAPASCGRGGRAAAAVKTTRRSRPRSPQSQRIPVICAPSITRPVNRMF